jgi:hypothetical protein
MLSAVISVGCSLAGTPTDGEAAIGTKSTTQSAASEAPWPADKQALEMMLPTAELGDSKPLINAWEMAYGTEWELVEPASVAGASCKTTLKVMDDGWSCVLSAPFSFADQGVTQRAETMANFTYGAPMASRLTLAELEPVPKRLVVEGIPCADFVHYASGRLYRCILATDHAFGSIVLPADSDVERTQMNTFQVCVTKPVNALTQVIPADTCFIIDDKGNIEMVEDGFGM